MDKWVPNIYTPKAAFSAFLPEDASSRPAPLSDSDNAILDWSKARISELKVVNIVGALIAAVVGGTFSWADMNTAPWTVKACFYCSLVFSLFAVGNSTQQAVTLYNVGPSSVSRLREYLWERRKWRLTHYVLSLPLRMLDLAIGVFLLGLLILVYDRAAKSGVWGDDTKIALVVSLAALFVLVSHVVGGMFVLKMEKALYRSEDNGTDEQNAQQVQ